MRLFGVLITGIVAVFYAIMWYLDKSVPAWHVLIWVLFSFVDELENYLDRLPDNKKHF